MSPVSVGHTDSHWPSRDYSSTGLFRRLTGLLGSIPEGVPLFLEPRSRASGSYDDFCDLRSLAVKQLWARWTVRSET